jgi:hypothetical protein
MNEYGAAVGYIKRGKQRNLFQCYFVHHKSHWTDLGSKPGLRVSVKVMSSCKDIDCKGQDAHRMRTLMINVAVFPVV